MSYPPHSVVEPHMSLTQQLTTTSLLRRYGGSTDALADALGEATDLYFEDLKRHEVPCQEDELRHFLFWLRNLRDERQDVADREVRAAKQALKVEETSDNVARLLRALEERDRL